MEKVCLLINGDYFDGEYVVRITRNQTVVEDWMRVHRNIGVYRNIIRGKRVYSRRCKPEGYKESFNDDKVLISDKLSLSGIDHRLHFADNFHKNADDNSDQNIFFTVIHTTDRIREHARKKLIEYGWYDYRKCVELEIT